MIDKSVECLKRKNVDSLENLRVIKKKQQAPNLKKILTKAEFSQKQVGVYKCPDKICECRTSQPLGNSCTFKNMDKTFNLKAYFSCDSLLYILLYIFNCPTCVGKTKLRHGV